MGERFEDDAVEASSGKGADDENFPVGSFLIAGPLRPHVKAYYDFARAADDIADAPHLDPADKIHRLDAFDAVLRGRAEGLSKPAALRHACGETGVPLERGSDLLIAFRQDAHLLRYETFDALKGYCANSAEPVGRFLLDLHGEDPDLYPASDGLCTALQVLNHLQDMKQDLEHLDRCYLPLRWLEEEGETLDAVRAAETSPGLRRVIDRLLAGIEPLLARAEGLHFLTSRRLAAESAIILRLARRLHARLAKGDPLATRVALSKGDFAAAGAAGVAAAVFRRGGSHPKERAA